jgi:hypothetical protein
MGISASSRFCAGREIFRCSLASCCCVLTPVGRSSRALLTIRSRPGVACSGRVWHDANIRSPFHARWVGHDERSPFAAVHQHLALIRYGGVAV